MDNSIFSDEVRSWEEYFSKMTTVDEKIVELAFFKQFVKFELFISELFIHYCIGGESFRGYKPNRKLEFIDRKHFDGVLNYKNEGYIDYFQSIHKLSPHFLKDDNSFNIFISPEHIAVVNEMKSIRNYIAHGSLTSKNKYEKDVLNNNSFNNNFIEPDKFLLSKRKGTEETNYTVYITKMTEISSYLIDGPLL